jgi:hypothetical protein
VKIEDHKLNLKPVMLTPEGMSSLLCRGFNSYGLLLGLKQQGIFSHERLSSFCLVGNPLFFLKTVTHIAVLIFINYLYFRVLRYSTHK